MLTETLRLHYHGINDDDGDGDGADNEPPEKLSRYGH